MRGGGGGRDTLRSHMAQPQEGIIWLAMHSRRLGWTFRSRQNHGSSWQTSCGESFTWQAILTPPASCMRSLNLLGRATNEEKKKQLTLQSNRMALYNCNNHCNRIRSQWHMTQRALDPTEICIPLFIDALLTRAKNGIRPSCPSTDECVMKIYIYCIHTHTRILLSSKEKWSQNYREWIILKCIILIEVIYSQEKKTSCSLWHVGASQ